MTAKLVDELTDTRSSKTREASGQGTAQIVTGLFGGMGGCAVIGQTMINVKVSGARTRLSTFLAGAFLLVLVVGFGDVVARIPMAALVAVMFLVCYGAFDWHSVRPSTLRAMPRSETAVMVLTVVIVLLTHNLAYGVLGGTLLACVLFARRVAHLVEVRAERHRGRAPLHRPRAGVLRLLRGPRDAVRLRRRPARRDDRLQRRARVGRLLDRRARRRHPQVRRPRQARRDRRDEPRDGGAARPARGARQRRLDRPPAAEGAPPPPRAGSGPRVRSAG